MADKRVAVFVDYQNVYCRARSCLGLEGASHPEGQVHPVRLAQRIVDKRPDRLLAGVRVYRGLPDSTKDPKAYGASRRQMQAWEMDPRTSVFARTLRYPGAWPAEKAQEKGVDVALAVDFVLMAVKAEYDVGVLVSNDTDLLPALEGALALEGTPVEVEVASWQPDTGFGHRLRIPGEKLWCNWLDRSDYEAVVDRRDYNVITRATGK